MSGFRMEFDTLDLKRLEKSLDKLGMLPQKVVTSAVNKGTTVVKRSIRGEAPVRTGALKRGIIRGAEHPKKKISGKKVNDLKFDPKMNKIFQKPIKNPGVAGGERPTGYYPASMEHGFLTRSKGGGYHYVSGHHFMREGAEESKKEFDQTIIKDMTQKLEKEWRKKNAT